MTVLCNISADIALGVKYQQQKERDMNEQDELLTVAEVAKMLRVDGTTVRRWISSGVLEAVRLPHRAKRQAYRIKRYTIDKLLQPAAA